MSPDLKLYGLPDPSSSRVKHIDTESDPVFLVTLSDGHAAHVWEAFDKE